MKIGFLINQLDSRGTGNAVYNYAHYNETLLGNESTIYTYANTKHDPEAAKRFMDRFNVYARHPSAIDDDVVYHIKSGLDDGIRAGKRYVVHSVFDYEPHGDRYAMISRWLAQRSGPEVPWVPHMIDLADHSDNYREELGIPKSAVVFGRHGAYDTFDVGFAWSAIDRALRINPSIHFVFMNTEKPKLDLGDRVFFLPQTLDPYLKRKFLNTCDVMVHARARGETFGIAVGEFSILGKYIITYDSPWERAHIDEGRVGTVIYKDEDELLNHLLFEWKKYTSYEKYSPYRSYTPKLVMQKFKEVFLDA